MSGFILARSYLHTQDEASTTWVINHGLGVEAPMIDCWINDGGNKTLILADTVAHTDAFTTTVTFSVAQIGEAVVS